MDSDRLRFQALRTYYHGPAHQTRTTAPVKRSTNTHGPRHEGAYAKSMLHTTKHAAAYGGRTFATTGALPDGVEYGVRQMEPAQINPLAHASSLVHTLCTIVTQQGNLVTHSGARTVVVVTDAPQHWLGRGSYCPSRSTGQQDSRHRCTRRWKRRCTRWTCRWRYPRTGSQPGSNGTTHRASNTVRALAQ